MNNTVNYKYVAQRLVALTDGVPYERPILPMPLHCSGSIWKISTGWVSIR